MWVIGHRGAPGLAVENSLAALRIAVDQGADGVEFDVALTADSEPVLFHDDTLQRMTAQPGKLADTLWRDLRHVSQSAAGLQAQPIAHLEAVLEWWQGQRRADPLPWLNIELKLPTQTPTKRVRALAETVARQLAGLPADRVVVSSFSRAALLAFTECAPELRRGALIDDQPGGDWAHLLLTPQPTDDVHQLHPPWAHLTHDTLLRWQALRQPVWTWTVNDVAQWDRACQWAVDGFIAATITDHPGALARFAEKNLPKL